MDFSRNLSEAQQKRLHAAMDKGTDFTVKLANQALSGAEFSFLSKIQARKLEQNKASGKGMILKLNSKQVNQLKKGSSYPPTPVPAFSGAMTKKLSMAKKSSASASLNEALKKRSVKRGGVAIPAVVGVSAGVISILNSIGVMEPLKALVISLGKELEYIIINPHAAKWRNIYAERLPTLARKWRDLGNDIEFLLRKPKQTNVLLNRVNRIERKRADIVSLAEMLLEQLPRYKALAEAKDEQIASREQAKMTKKINDLESQLASLKGEPLIGDGLQVDAAPRGYGLQVSPPTGAGRGRKKKST